jgi:hypothetical protein
MRKAESGHLEKQMNIRLLPPVSAQREADKEPDVSANPQEPDEPDKDDREQYGFGKFDKSVGSQSQKSAQHPMGDTAIANRAFWAREIRLMHNMRRQVAQGVKGRWK